MLNVHNDFERAQKNASGFLIYPSSKYSEYPSDIQIEKKEEEKKPRALELTGSVTLADIVAYRGAVRSVRSWVIWIMDNGTYAYMHISLSGFQAGFGILIR